MSRIQSHLTYANVMATLALFVALGGASYAAVKLPAASVGTKQIRDGSIATKDLSASAIKSLSGRQGPQGPPGPAGVAGFAGAQGAQGGQGLAGPSDLKLKWFTHQADFSRVDNYRYVDVRCDDGWVPVSGGFGIGELGKGDKIIGSTPTLPGIGPTGGDNGNFSGWTVSFEVAPGTGTFTAAAAVLCAQGTNAGAAVK